MADTVDKITVILRGEYKPKLDNGSDVIIKFEVHKFRNSSSSKNKENYVFFINDLDIKNNRFKFKDELILTHIDFNRNSSVNGGVPVKISDDRDKYIFFGDTHVRKYRLPRVDQFFNVTLDSYDHFIKNIVDRDIPWENVELLYDNMKITTGLEGTWTANEFFEGGSYRKHIHHKPTKRRRNRRRNRKTKKN
jgi:hypothetical protein